MKRFAHKTVLLLTALLLILLALPVAALADSGKEENEFTKTVNGYQVTLVFEKPAIVGENQISVLVSDAQNMPISNANVEVSVDKSETEHTEAGTSAHDEMPGMTSMSDMPGMSGMSEQSAEAPSTGHGEMNMTALEAGHESGEYAGKIAIETTGDCVIRVHLTVQGELTKIDFPLTVIQSKTGSGILAGFFAANVAIIGAALVLKPKPVSITLSKKA